MKLAVGIATLGRPDILKLVVERLALQSRRPHAIFIAPASDKDALGIEFDNKSIIKVTAPRGLTKQRNAIIEKCRDYDLIVFFDDDFVPHNDYLKEIEQEFINHSQTVIATGSVVSDGARNAGLSFVESVDYANHAKMPTRSRETDFNAYGCNMAIRLATVFHHSLRFDEHLPSYGWLEDLDFSRRIMAYGDCIKIPTAIGAHMGHKAGRTSGIRYGYSQVANPLYIAAKNTGFSYLMAYKMFTKNFIANSVRSIKPEPYVDRIGRLKGNLIAFWDLLLGRLEPEKIEHL